MFSANLHKAILQGMPGREWKYNFMSHTYNLFPTVIYSMFYLLTQNRWKVPPPQAWTPTAPSNRLDQGRLPSTDSYHIYNLEATTDSPTTGPHPYLEWRKLTYIHQITPAPLKVCYYPIFSSHSPTFGPEAN